MKSPSHGLLDARELLSSKARPCQLWFLSLTASSHLQPLPSFTSTRAQSWGTQILSLSSTLAVTWRGKVPKTTRRRYSNSPFQGSVSSECPITCLVWEEWSLNVSTPSSEVITPWNERGKFDCSKPSLPSFTSSCSQKVGTSVGKNVVPDCKTLSFQEENTFSSTWQDGTRLGSWGRKRQNSEKLKSGWPFL